MAMVGRKYDRPSEVIENPVDTSPNGNDIIIQVTQLDLFTLKDAMERGFEEYRRPVVVETPR